VENLPLLIDLLYCGAFHFCLIPRSLTDKIVNSDLPSLNILLFYISYSNLEKMDIFLVRISFLLFKRFKITTVNAIHLVLCKIYFGHSWILIF